MAVWLAASLLGFLFPLIAQAGSCPDVSEESHHQLLFENQGARVFALNLPRLSTASYCLTHQYLYIVAGPGRTSITIDDHAPMSYDWNGPEARFVYLPKQRSVRNETGQPHRELVVELLREVAYDPLTGGYDGDLFPADLGGAKPTWTVSFSRGPLSAYKVQLAPGAEFRVNSAMHVLLAITDLDLRTPDNTRFQMSAQDVKVLPANSGFKLVNNAQSSAKFIVLEF